MPIDVGPGAIDRAASAGGQTDTWIDLDNPANESGTIDTVELWLVGGADNFKVGFFYNAGGTNYTCSSSATLGAVASGSKQTFSDLSLSVEAGDFIGYWCWQGSMKLDTGGATRLIRSNDGTDHVTAEEEADFSTGWDTWAVSIYGTGTAGGGGGPDIGSLDSIEAASISTVDGMAWATDIATIDGVG